MATPINARICGDDLASGHNIVATVFAECHSMYRLHGPEQTRSLGETELYAVRAAMSASGDFGSTKACDVMFGNVDLTLGAAVEPLLEQHLEASGGAFGCEFPVVGIRTSESTMSLNKPASWFDPRVSDAVKVINRMGLSGLLAVSQSVR